jgi:DNA-binding LytR/AlgR family response regulator
MMVLNILIPRIFSGFFNDELWNISKEIFWNIINISVIGLFNYLIFIYLYTSTFSWSGIIWFQFATLSIGILPVSLGILVKEQRERKKYEEDAAEMLPPLKSQELSNQSGAQNHIITIPSLNQEEPFISEISDLLFIKSADNYIEIIHSKDESISRVMLRNTLKNLESELQPFDMLFRCHKSYLINLDKVLRISGNAQGFKFHIEGFDQAVPVSRQHNELIKKRFAIRP